ncbi:hypothetical protein QF046_001818 [Microbacterium sp. W4I4]|uniref:hypothetical protein n=1 Tax=Microbacterium sp. W4I4 TaxID=3042295 RepID=UPI00277D19F9|nr:hypothetical protein [Microbacterium sp. W4I4]MDQ0614177.1 hypothetical protein [Microbacterium sp. W4I4]
MMVNAMEGGGGGGVQMDADTADSQTKLIIESRQSVAESRKVMASLGEGQTAVLWTDDGRSVDLMRELKARYDAAQLWLDSIDRSLDEAARNLNKAISETTQLDADQKVQYQNLLYRAVGTTTPKGPIAV